MVLPHRRSQCIRLRTHGGVEQHDGTTEGGNERTPVCRPRPMTGNPQGLATQSSALPPNDAPALLSPIGHQHSHDHLLTKCKADGEFIIQHSGSYLSARECGQAARHNARHSQHDRTPQDRTTQYTATCSSRMEQLHQNALSHTRNRSHLGSRVSGGAVFAVVGCKGGQPTKFGWEQPHPLRNRKSTQSPTQIKTLTVTASRWCSVMEATCSRWR